VEEQLVDYVQKKKKSYSGLAVLILLVTLGVTSYMFVVNHYKFSGPIGIGYKYIEKLYDGSKKSEVAKIEYDDSVNVNDYFTFTLDDGFKKDGVVYKYTTADQGENNYCSFSFRKVKNYNDANSLLQAVKSLNKANGKVETEEINGIIYSKFILNKDNGKHTYLSVRHKETIFMIDYFSGKDTAQNVCDNMLEDIKGSLVKVGETTEEKK
jgi:methyltransferase-like protein